MRAEAVEGSEDEVATLCTERVVDGAPVLVDDGLEPGIAGACRRQLDGGEPGVILVALLPAAAGEHRHRQPGALHCRGERGGAPPMADAEEMLDMEEDAP